ncbi:unnamed protein product [Peronospora destructor]|uniref:HORMA domain-containing protein n=1 Tax=Peronospora destructor TaxID=86335 RepID=A0AAV0UAA5_9STRA|nr:unnamed protein product [Peronospora destructor]
MVRTPGKRVDDRGTAATAQISENLITLKGSTEIVTEFFSYSINTILYQRGIYPEESFKQVQKYGLNMLMTADDKLNDFFTKFLHQLSNWIVKGEVQKMVLVITGIETHEVLERWAFEVHSENGTGDSAISSKSKKEIMAEIQAIIRQITASVSFLPLLEEQCAFDLLVYTDKNSEVPALWEESDPRYIKDSAEVRLRSFSTKVHKIDAMVAYRNPEADV